MARLKYNLIGQTFGDWEVLSKTDSDAGNTKWKCRCTCGTIRNVTSRNLREGKSKGCGCKRSERVSKGKVRHGQSAGGKRTRLYNIWATIKQRCGKYPGYESVTLHEPWFDSFEEFAKGVGKPPTPKHSLDRIECDGNYEPGNVRWATPAEQGRNKSNTIKLTYRGETKPLRQWADELGIPAVTLHARVRRYGMSVEEAFNTPVREQKNNVKLDEKAFFKEWAEQVGLDPEDLAKRVREYLNNA